METLYRKVTFEINDKNHDETWLIGKSANFIFNPNTRNGEELSDFLAGCEEVPDNKSLLKQNEEMKAMLEKIVLVTDNFNGSFQDFKERYNSEIEKLLNKTT